MASRRRPVGAAARGTHVLRIIGGTWRGRRVPVADAPGLRPTPDRVRETLFNWLAPRMPGSRCLDLFAGTGALGLEALSRGAGECVFVEANPRVARHLRATLVSLGAHGAQVVEADALAWLAGDHEPFDVIFLDPPFDGELLAEAGARIAAGAMLRTDGRLYLEGPAARALPVPAGWVPLRERTAGQVRFALLAPAPAAR